jgi:hypothetical protein
MDGACVGDGGDSFHVEDVIQTSNSVIFSLVKVLQDKDNAMAEMMQTN